MTSPIIESTRHLCDLNALYNALCRKQLKIRQVQKEIEALNSAIVLLADDENELFRSPPRRPESESRPWPIPTSTIGDDFDSLPSFQR
jgi:hypothetical protein